MHSFEDSTILWKAAIENPAPLFKSDPEDPMAAVFDTKGFFLSPEAKRLYNQEIEMDGKTFKLKNLPHIYTARTESENDFYFGISNQKGGRWKRSHAYHLRTPAYQILHKVPLRTRGDQDHWQWVQSWFDLASVQARGDDYVIRMNERKNSYLFLHPKCED